jgi:uncharacterized protein
MAWRDRLRDFENFDWDTANIEKLWRRHHVTPTECEEVFFDDDTLVLYDSEHSYDEDPYHALGRTAMGRLLFIVFTVRGRRIRPLSARDMTRHEQAAYARQEKSAEAPSKIRKRRHRK